MSTKLQGQPSDPPRPSAKCFGRARHHIEQAHFIHNADRSRCPHTRRNFHPAASATTGAKARSEAERQTTDRMRGAPVSGHHSKRLFNPTLIGIGAVALDMLQSGHRRALMRSPMLRSEGCHDQPCTCFRAAMPRCRPPNGRTIYATCWQPLGSISIPWRVYPAARRQGGERRACA